MQRYAAFHLGLNCLKKYSFKGRVQTGKFVPNSRTFQGLHKDSPSVFKDYNFMKNTNLNYKILLLKPTMRQ